ncbi:hypothetical protein NL108_009511, partial [Boleophthalmus pectinirostris]
MLDENHHLIQCIMDYQSKGKTAECTQYQQILHRNLVYLATIADSNQNMQSLLPAPPTHNMGMSQGSGHTSGNDNMTSGLTPTSMMQSNGKCHNQTPMQQQQSGQVPPTAHSTYVHGGHPSQSSMVQGPGPAYASSSSSASFSSRSNLNIQSNQVSMMHQSGTPHYSSAQLGGQHYQGQQAVGLMGQGSQGNNMMSQRPMGTYRTSQPGSAQQYMGEDKVYGEQYRHTQSSSEPINPQYYPDGHGDYSYQQSSYGEQYERSFDESSQHYYEGNSQYSQQQGQYQQGSSQQSFGQQQYSSQPSYGGPPQGY